MTNFHGLDNKQIIFCYLNNLNQLERIEELIEDASFTSSIPFLGSDIMLSMYLSEESIQKLKDHKMYSLLYEVDVILYPIVELIKDAEPELYEEVLNAYNISLDDLL
jgi:hypothetical protein